MAEWTDIIFEKCANYFNKSNEVFAANIIVNNYDIHGIWDEYEPVLDDEGMVVDWKPKPAIYARGGRADIVFTGIDEDGFVYINGNKYNGFESLKPVEKRGLYDLYIDNHMDIPDTISKDSPCYKQFMKEKYSI